MMNTSAELNLGLAEDRIMSAPKGLVKGYILNKAEFEKQNQDLEAALAAAAKDAKSASAAA